jgi:precorrin-3B synthase
MPSGDGWVVRVRPPCGRLDKKQAQGIARLALQYAMPLLDLTSRANIQLRGVTEANYPALMCGLQALDLIDADSAAESRRNVMVTPYWTVGDGTLEIANALVQALTGPQAPTLPGKFGFALDCGAIPVLRKSSADVRIERAGTGYVVYAEGSTAGAYGSAQEAVPLAMNLANWFIQAGGVHEGRGRMANLLSIRPIPAQFEQKSLLEVPLTPPSLGLVDQGYMVGFEFGQLPAETLAALAGIAPLRLSPWRSLLVEGATEIPALEGTITRMDDVRLRVVACTGAPGCTQAAAPTRPLAHALAAYVPVGQMLHVSGCVKGCAHPGTAITLVAGTAGFDFIQNGTATSAPDMHGLDESAIATHLQQLQEHASHL